MKQVLFRTFVILALLFMGLHAAWAAPVVKKTIRPQDKFRPFDGKKINPKAGDFLWELENLPEPEAKKPEAASEAVVAELAPGDIRGK